MKSRRLLALCAHVSLIACHRSGTWEDDPKNFERAWGVEPPKEVAVVHSWYWRSAHFTREEIYFFQLRGDTDYAEAFARENDLQPTDAGALGVDAFLKPKPSWFAPKEPRAYEAWHANSGSAGAVILLDRLTGDIFIHAWQL